LALATVKPGEIVGSTLCRLAFGAFVKIAISGVAAQPVPRKSECDRFVDDEYRAVIGDRSRLDFAALPGVTFLQPYSPVLSAI